MRQRVTSCGAATAMMARDSRVRPRLRRVSASWRRRPRPGTAAQPQASAFPSAADVESYRNNVEPLFMRDRGGTMPGYAACVMCHTWQTSLRFSLETPATEAGWTRSSRGATSTW